MVDEPRFSGIRRLFRAPRTRSAIGAQVDDEIRFHLASRADDLVAIGLTLDVARAQAEREFGDLVASRAELARIDRRLTGRERRAEWWDELRLDLRYAARTLRRSRGFTVAAIATLALGVGANTAIFSVVNAVLLRPLPYRAPGRLVSVDSMYFKGEFLELERRARSIDVAAYLERDVSLTGVGEPLHLYGAEVTPNLFPLLGATPALGRGFAAEERLPGRDAVVLLSDALWRARFGGDRAIIGRTVDLDGVRRTVVGVMPPALRFPDSDTQLWIPVVLDPADRITLWSTGVRMVGRLRPGVTLSSAQAEIGSLGRQVRELFPWRMAADYGMHATVSPLLDHVVGSARPLLLTLLGAVALVLLIACVNVANLLLVRTQARQHELAVRAALGAGAGRLARQLFAESLLLAAAGGAAGIAVAFLGVRALVATLPPDTPRLSEIGIDARVLGVALAVVLTTGLAFGLAPARRAARADPNGTLREGGRGSSATRERRRLAGVLVAAEIALAMVLATGAGLLVRSFWNLLSSDPGFHSDGLVTATVVPSVERYPDDARRRAFYADLVQRLDAMPGVASAAVTNRLPFGGRTYASVFKIDGRPDPAAASSTGDWPLADVAGTISAGYLGTMGMRLTRGRAFSADDRLGAPPVVLVNESLARRYWPGEDVLGKRIRGPGQEPWMTIVGVVGPARFASLGDTSASAFFRPLAQSPADAAMSLVVRSRGDPRAVAASLRAAVSSLDPDTPVSDIRPMRELIAASLARPRFATVLLVTFGLVALALGGVGIYGVIAYTVSQRTAEIALRMALGAHPADVVSLVVRHGAALTAAGVAVGLAAAAALTRVMSSLLYGVRPLDGATFAAAPLVIVMIALAASWVPARRAARTSPMDALRGDTSGVSPAR